MSRIAVTAAAYGATELKQATKKYTTWALVIAACIHTLFLTGYRASTYFIDAPPPKRVHIIYDPLLLPPPPSISSNPKGMPVMASLDNPTAKPNVGNPVPVPDAEVNPNQTFASQDQMNQVSGPVNEGIEGGDFIIEPKILLNNIVEDEAPPKDFVPFAKEPVILKRIEPIYPELARKAGLEGTVIVKLWVNKEGKVKDVVLLKSSSDIFSQAAIDAAKQWFFTPALMKTGPVSVWVSTTFHFRLK